MRRIITLVLLLGISGSACALESYRILYDVRMSGLRGQIETTLNTLPATDGDNALYEFKSVTHTKGLAKLFVRDDIVEWSHFSSSGDSYQPIEFNYINGKPDHKRSNRITFNGNHAASRYKFVTVELDILPGHIDRMLEQLLVREALMAGQTPPTYKVVDRNEISTVNYVARGTQTLDTPAGSLETVIFSRERPDSNRTTHIWFAPKLDYQPVRIEQHKNGETTAVAKLRSYELIAAD